MQNLKDYYRILGVTRDASAAAIKRAYRRLSQKLVPNPSGALEDLAELQQAYETLSDAERRRRYDESLSDPWRDLPAWALVRAPAVGELRRPSTPGTLAGEIVLTPKEARLGGLLPLDMPLVTACPACKGTGGPAFDCSQCYGEGKLQHRLPVPVRMPAGVRPGTVFQVFADDSEIQTILLTVHVRAV